MRAATHAPIDEALVERTRDRLVEAFRSAAEEMSPFAVAVRSPNPENIPSEQEARRLVGQVDTIRSEVRDPLFPEGEL